MQSFLNLRRAILACTSAVLLANFSANAATISMVNSNASGENWDTPASDWAGGQSPSLAPNNDFLVGNTFLVRSPDGVASATFPGLSLQLDAGSIFRLKGGDGSTIQVADLRLNGGVIHNGNGGGSGNPWDMTLLGGISVLAPSFIDVGEMAGNVFNQSGTNDQYRRLVLQAELSGFGLLSVGTDAADGDVTDITVANFAAKLGASVLEITSGNNSFSGGWSVVGGILRGVTLGGLGTGNISIGNAAGLELDYDLSLPGGSFTLDGVTRFDTNWTFGSATIAGQPLAPGVYSNAQLAAQFPSNVVAGSTGSLTVVPEPACALLMMFGAGALSLRRRRG